LKPRAILVGMPAALLALTQACGSSNVSQPQPGPSLTPPPGGYVVAITASGPNPQTLHVWVGRKASVVNQDSRARTVFSDPHPDHDRCSGRLNLGTLAPGERRDLENLPIDACFFHDEDDPANAALRGLILVH
jgi:hypothetical protein